MKNILTAFIVFLFSSMSFAGDLNYVKKINENLTGTWSGKFEHLWLVSDGEWPLTVTLKIKKLALTSSAIAYQLLDENPVGEVLIESRKQEEFSVSSISIESAYSPVFSGGSIQTPNIAYVVVHIENTYKKTKLTFPIGLFKNSYQQIMLGGETFGTLKKQ